MCVSKYYVDLTVTFEKCVLGNKVKAYLVAQVLQQKRMCYFLIRRHYVYLVTSRDKPCILLGQ